MSKFHKVKVKDVRRETDDTVSIAFDLPRELQPEFEYEAGQYLTIRTSIHDQSVNRSYSLCSSPEDAEWRVAVKKVPGGLFSTFANEVLSIGDEVELMPPMGKFHIQNNGQSAHQYVFFAAGSGITPIISIIKTILRTEPLSQCILFYGNRYADGIIFKEELDDLKNKNIGKLSVHHILSQERLEAPLFNGRIDAEKCATFSKVFFDLKEVHTFFLCGPEQMILTVQAFLQENGVSEEKIKFELFTTPTSKAAPLQVKTEHKTFDPSKESALTVRIDGYDLDFTLPYAGKNILDATIDNGGDAPFACKGGVCCTCKAMLVKGEVEMDTVYGLEQDEIEAGYILTCQSHPRSEKVIVDYDV